MKLRVDRCKLALAVGAVMVVFACGPSNRAAEETAVPDAELTSIFEDDQAARSLPIEQIDVAALARLDSARRDRVRRRVSAGALRSAADYYHAAMIFQHGTDSLAYRQAHEWALRSEVLDSTNEAARWLVAASWDRYQMSRGRPQWYGTQTDRIPRGIGPVVLYAIDTTRVTDAEREWRGVGTLRQLRARLDSVNLRLGLR